MVLDAGQIAQVGTPRELYERPVNRFVAQFIGSPKMNILSCRTGDGSYQLPGGRGGSFAGDREAIELGIRPEHIAIKGHGGGQCDGVVDVVEYLGADTFIIVDCGQSAKVTVRITGSSDLKPGNEIGLSFAEDKIRFLDASGLAV